MLKNIKIYTLFLITLSFIACSEDNEVEPLFDQDGATRTAELLKSYKKTLTDAEFGWRADYLPEGDEALFRIHLKFNEDNTVETTSDYKNGDNDLPSTYRVGVNQLPELVFENYSTLHSLFEAQRFVLGAEFEFIFVEVSSEKVILKSKTDQGEEKSILTLVKATATDKDEVLAFQSLEARIKDGHLTSDFFRTLTVTDGSSQKIFASDFTFDDETRRGIFSGEDNNSDALSFNLPLKITETGFDFLVPFSFNGIDFVSFTYNETTNAFVSTVGDLTTTISSSIEPGFISDDVFTIGESDSGSRFLYRQSFTNPLTTEGFSTIINQISAATNTDFGLDFSQYFFETNPKTPGNNTTLSIDLVDPTDTNTVITFFYEFEANIVDKKLILTYLGPSATQGGNPAFNGLLEPYLQPLINFYGNSLGLIYTDRGNFLNFSNMASTFLNIEDPSLSVYGVWVNF